MRYNKLAFMLAATMGFGGVQVATAADMAVKARPSAPVAVYNWTGFYLGIEGGGAWGRSKHVGADPAFSGVEIASFNLSGGLFGATAGYNWQAIGSPWVFGIEGDWSWTNKKGSAHDLAPFNNVFVQETKEKWFATFRGRVGYAWDRWMLYATGGGAVARINASEFNSTNPTFGVYDSKTRFGWTLGAGVEGAIAGNWTAKAEYLYVDYGKIGFFAPPLTPGNCGCIAADVSVNNHIFRVGLNYLFK
jgi:outer membrane immunogenic protein